MKIKLKKLNENAVVPFKHYDKDFCYDCVATSCEEIAPNVWKYGLGIALQIDKNNMTGQRILIKGIISSIRRESGSIYLEQTEEIYEDLILSIDLRPRSSIWKTGMVLSNSVGTVDELYNGEISAVFYHLMTDMPKYKIGDRIAQCKLGFTVPMEFVEVDKLDETERGDGGYGSTDKIINKLNK